MLGRVRISYINGRSASNIVSIHGEKVPLAGSAIWKRLNHTYMIWIPSKYIVDISFNQPANLRCSDRVLIRNQSSSWKRLEIFSKRSWILVIRSNDLNVSTLVHPHARRLDTKTFQRSHHYWSYPSQFLKGVQCFLHTRRCQYDMIQNIIIQIRSFLGSLFLLFRWKGIKITIQIHPSLHHFVHFCIIRIIGFNGRPRFNRRHVSHSLEIYR
mmetsp:Transcript_26863/g.65285  ORF Transcript_26863/g.65285 Transcript_26863/m.65285 type:complete len:212 (-) Transcript_26863:969-1604(-)